MKVGTKNKPLIAHLAILGSCIGWGLMTPICKDAMLLSALILKEPITGKKALGVSGCSTRV